MNLLSLLKRSVNNILNMPLGSSTSTDAGGGTRIQYRVQVPAGVQGGQWVRVSAAGWALSMQFPLDAVPGDVFGFTMYLPPGMSSSSMMKNQNSGTTGTSTSGSQPQPSSSSTSPAQAASSTSKFVTQGSSQPNGNSNNSSNYTAPATTKTEPAVPIPTQTLSWADVSHTMTLADLERFPQLIVPEYHRAPPPPPRSTAARKPLVKDTSSTGSITNTAGTRAPQIIRSTNPTFNARQTNNNNNNINHNSMPSYMPSSSELGMALAVGMMIGVSIVLGFLAGVLFVTPVQLPDAMMEQQQQQYATIDSNAMTCPRIMQTSSSSSNPPAPSSFLMMSSSSPSRSTSTMTNTGAAAYYPAPQQLIATFMANTCGTEGEVGGGSDGSVGRGRSGRGASSSSSSTLPPICSQPTSSLKKLIFASGRYASSPMTPITTSSSLMCSLQAAPS